MSPNEPSENHSPALQQLIDREDVRALIYRFGRAIDTKDQALYASNFAEDGVLELPFGSIVGRADIANKMKGPPPGTHAHHLIGQMIIELNGDTASAITYMMATHVFSETSMTEKAHSGGWYEQKFVRTDEGWLFSHVKLVIRWEDERPMIDPKDMKDSSKESGQ